MSESFGEIKGGNTTAGLSAPIKPISEEAAQTLLYRSQRLKDSVVNFKDSVTNTTTILNEYSSVLNRFIIRFIEVKKDYLKCLERLSGDCQVLYIAYSTNLIFASFLTRWYWKIKVRKTGNKMAYYSEEISKINNEINQTKINYEKKD